MTNTLEISDYITKTYPIQKQNMIIDIITLLSHMNKLLPLNDKLGVYLDTRSTVTDAVNTALGFEILIIEYVIETVINPECNIILTSDTNTPLVFILGLLEFHYNVNFFHPVRSLELSDILNTDEIDSVHKIGVLVNYYQSDFYDLDAYPIINIVPEEVIEVYSANLDTLITNEETDPETISNLIHDLNVVDTALVGTKLFTYMITHNAYLLTDNQILAYLTTIIKVNGLNAIALAKELAVFSVLTGKTSTDMTDIVNTLYEEFNTVVIVDYLNNVLRDNNAY